MPEVVTHTKETLVTLIRKHHKASIANALECGRYLKALQEMLNYGEYEATIERDLPFSIPTAQLYRRIYERLELHPEHRESVLTMTLNEADQFLKLIVKPDMDAFNSRKRKNLSGWSRQRFVPPAHDAEGTSGPDERPWDLRSLAVELSNKLGDVGKRHGDEARKRTWYRIAMFINGQGGLEGIPGEE